jgi:hypothetical protein
MHKLLLDQILKKLLTFNTITSPDIAMVPVKKLKMASADVTTNPLCQGQPIFVKIMATSRTSGQGRVLRQAQNERIKKKFRIE